jgi:hypothetical protein
MHRPNRTLCLPVVILLPLVWLLGSQPSLAQTGDRLDEFIGRTGEIIEWAAELVQESENQQARRILEEAKNLHQRSLDLLDRDQPRQALTISQRARAAAQHAAKLARETHGHQERLRLRLDRYLELRDQLLDRAREAENERALRFVRESELQAYRAQDHYRQGNFDLALHLLTTAEELLARATRLLFEGGGGERLEREMERTRALIDRAAEQLHGTGGGQRETSQDLLDSAREALARAEDQRERQQPLQALQSLRLANRLASQSVAIGGTRTDPAAVAEQLHRWDERQEAVAEQVQESGSRQALTVLERARHHRLEAGRRLDAGELEPALRQIKAAFDLLNEANDLTR